jgi:hypothetical protein
MMVVARLKAWPFKARSDRGGLGAKAGLVIAEDGLGAHPRRFFFMSLDFLKSDLT